VLLKWPQKFSKYSINFENKLKFKFDSSKAVPYKLLTATATTETNTKTTAITAAPTTRLAAASP
jgi:hypothetical protein